MRSGGGGDEVKKILPAVSTVSGIVAAPFTGGMSVPAAIATNAALAAPGIIGSFLPPNSPKPSDTKASMPSSQALGLGTPQGGTTLPTGGSALSQIPTVPSYAMNLLRNQQGGGYA